MFDFISSLFANASALPSSKKNKRKRGRTARIEELESREMLDAGLMAALDDVFENSQRSGGVIPPMSQSETVLADVGGLTSPALAQNTPSLAPLLAKAAPAGYSAYDWGKLEAVWGALETTADLVARGVDARWETRGGELRLIELYAPEPPLIPSIVINLSGCEYLEKVDVCGNDLEELDVSGCTALTSLICNANKLETLNVSGCVNLESLVCDDNQLTEILDIADCTKLQALWCNNNRLAFSTLPPTISNLEGYTYAPQHPMQVFLATGNEVDLSSEHGSNSNVGGITTYTWYYSDETEVSRDDYSESGGIFTFFGLDDGDVIFCRMTNTNYPQLFDGGWGADYRLKTEMLTIGETIERAVFTSATPAKTSMFLEWTIENDPDGFLLEYREVGSASWIEAPITLDPADREATVVNLKPNTNYEFRLTTLTGERQPTSRISEVTKLDVPADFSFSCTDRTATSITCSWDDLTTNVPLSYTLLCIETGGTWSGMGTETSATISGTISGLNPNTPYTFSLTIAIGTDTDTLEIVATTSLATPTWFGCEPTGATSVKLTWNTVSDATGGYAIQYQVNGAGPWATLPDESVTIGTVTESAPTASVVISGLVSGSFYNFQVRALRTVGGINYDSAWSQSFLVDTVPQMPTGFTVMGKNATSVTLKWNPQNNLTGYRLEYQVEGASSWEPAITLGPSVTTAEVIGLQSNTTYNFHLIAINTFADPSESAPATLKEKTDLSLLATPTNIVATGRSTNSLSITWNAVANATSYRIEWAAGNDGGFTTILGTATSTTTSYYISNLTADTAYHVRVKAYAGGYTESQWSEPGAGQPFRTASSSDVQIGAPTDVTLGEGTASTQVINWVGVADAAGYRIEWAFNTGFTQGLRSHTVVGSGVESYTITGLTGNTQYFARVVSTTSEPGWQDSPPSEHVTFRTEVSNKLATPTTIELRANTTTTLTIAWTAVEDATGYRIEWSNDVDFPPGFGRQPILGGLSTSYKITGLAKDTEYYVRVVATAAGFDESDAKMGTFSTSDVEVSDFIFFVQDRGEGENKNDVILEWDLDWGTVRPDGRFEYRLANGAWITWYVSPTGGEQKGELRIYGLVAGEYQFRYVETSGKITAVVAQPKATVVRGNPEAPTPVKPKVPKVKADPKKAVVDLADPNALNAAKYGYSWVTLQLSQKAKDQLAAAPNVVYEITYWDSKDKTRTPVGRIAVRAEDFFLGLKIEGLPKTGTSYTFQISSKNDRGENRNVSKDRPTRPAPALKITLKASTAKYAGVKKVTVDKTAATFSSVSIKWDASGVPAATNGFIIMVYGTKVGRGATAVTPLVHSEFVLKTTDFFYALQVEGLKAGKKYTVQVIATTASGADDALELRKGEIHPAYATIQGRIKVEEGVHVIKSGVTWSAVKTVSASTLKFRAVTKVRVSGAETVQLNWTLPTVATDAYKHFMVGYQSGKTEESIRWLPLSGLVVAEDFRGATFDRALLTGLGIELGSTKKFSFVVRAVEIVDGKIVNQSLDAKFVITPSKLK